MESPCCGFAREQVDREAVGDLGGYAGEKPAKVHGSAMKDVREVRSGDTKTVHGVPGRQCRELELQRFHGLLFRVDVNDFKYHVKDHRLSLSLEVFLHLRDFTS